MHDSEILLTLKRQQQLFVDPRRIALLKQIDRTGSLSQAAKALGISYKTAWDAMAQLNQLAPKPMLISATGGKGGGGAALTDYGKRFVQLYELLLTIEYRALAIFTQDDQLAPDDLLSATAKLSLQTSARNQLYAEIESVAKQSVLVKLKDEHTLLQVSVTEASIARLKLQPQQTVILLIKAPAVELTQSTVPQQPNQLAVKLLQKHSQNQQTELILSTSGGTEICALVPDVLADSIQIGQDLRITIQPHNIIIAALV